MSRRLRRSLVLTILLALLLIEAFLKMLQRLFFIAKPGVDEGYIGVIAVPVNVFQQFVDYTFSLGSCA